ncbi:MAG: hypothetical protein COA52_02425 [Hyphomicrobiales bacterium]|nr:MAG: hypothetical protein COA52_02425 [Hyphomicrobiales bacterium]
MSKQDSISRNANLAKWCVHILGPDEVHAMPTYEEAVKESDKLNGYLAERLTNHAHIEDILCFAHAAPWPHSDESHAEDLLAALGEQP